ncbi:MAG: hypothetical protein KBD01_16860 [Acidobacteria bacterium]|nr:hypothetical protein [Acidobacteriota bacterium]
MRRSWVLWVIALVLTLASAAWQRISGPTYPVRGSVVLGGREIDLRLTRSHAGAGDQPVRVVAPDPEVEGEIAWRRYPVDEPWRAIHMRRSGEMLEAELPHQPPAGKLEYQLRLRRGAEQQVFPARPAVTRFKGHVAAAVLVPHIVLMFAGMLWSTRAGLEALARGPRLRSLTLVALGLIVVGGLVLGPAVQQQAFDAWWTGVPWGWDLTDNKTLIAAVAWGWAAWRVRGGRDARASVLIAALVTLVIFVIPHSSWGSELDWSEVS